MLDFGILKIDEFEWVQKVPYELRWKGNTLYEICEGPPKDFFNWFEDERKFLVRDLMRALSNKKQGSDPRRVMKKWVSTYGFLGIQKRRAVFDEWLGGNKDILYIGYEDKSMSSDGTNRQTGERENLDDFWKEAEEFCFFWNTWSHVQMGWDLHLLEWIEFTETELPTDIFSEEVDNEYTFSTRPVFKMDPDDVGATSNFGFHQSLTEIERDPLPFLQSAASHWLITKIERKLFGVWLYSSNSNWIKDKYFHSGDSFNFSVKFKCYSLIDAMYLKLYLMMTNHQNLKICPYCRRVFNPKSANHKYCNYDDEDYHNKNSYHDAYSDEESEDAEEKYPNTCGTKAARSRNHWKNIYINKILHKTQDYKKHKKDKLHSNEEKYSVYLSNKWWGFYFYELENWWFYDKYGPFKGKDQVSFTGNKETIRLS